MTILETTLLEEYKSLSIRLHELQTFVVRDAFFKLEENERNLVKEQLATMEHYSDVLRARLAPGLMTEVVTIQSRNNALSNLLAIQGSKGKWDHEPYMHGMYNGMELAQACIEDRTPVFKNAPKRWGKDAVKKKKPVVAKQK